MKRFIPIALIVLVAAVSLGFRGGYWRGARTVAGNYYFEDSTTMNKLVVQGKAAFEDVVTFPAGWMLFDQLAPATNDSASSSIGTATNPYAFGSFKNTWVRAGGRYWGQDATGADSFWVYNDGAWQIYGSDNNIQFAPTKNTSWYMSTTSITPANDTVRNIGSLSYRLKEIFAKRIMLTLPDLSDTLVLSATGITGTAYIRGTATFTATMQVDTVEIVGTGANDFFWIQIKGATVTTAPFTYTCKANTVFVYCAEADTAVARASGYNWLRMQ